MSCQCTTLLYELKISVPTSRCFTAPVVLFAFRQQAVCICNQPADSSLGDCSCKSDSEMRSSLSWNYLMESLLQAMSLLSHHHAEILLHRGDVSNSDPTSTCTLYIQDLSIGLGLSLLLWHCRNFSELVYVGLVAATCRFVPFTKLIDAQVFCYTIKS